MKKLVLPSVLTMILATLSAWQPLAAQSPYTVPLFETWVEKNIPYGSAPAFAGGTENLVLDLYKPVGDDNCRRPLLVMVHGGGFIAGTKEDNDVVQICQQMAARGYVTASVHYRLGQHPASYYVPYAFCNDWLNPVGISKCIYFADTLEFYRAMYRAVQDVKGAIRFLKNRNEADSTDVNCVFVGGTSAGAITSLYVAGLDLPSERPPFTSAIDDAPIPDSDLTTCVPPPGNRQRPDLGQIEGTLHLGNFDARVQGVAAFMGGIFDPGLFAGSDTPAIYLYHRTDDLVVPCGYDRLFSLYPYCLNPINLCQPLANRPWIFGSCEVKNFIENMGTAGPPFFNDILDFGPADGDDCLDDPPGHSVNNIPLRCQNLSDFFAPVIAATGNVPSSVCLNASALPKAQVPVLTVYPNPAKGGVVYLDGPDFPAGEVSLLLFDVAGRKLVADTSSAFPLRWDLNGQGIAPGIYFLQVSAGDFLATVKVIF